jgi:hypothetical protein
MMLKAFCPDAVVFDGTWPFQGFMAACKAYGELGMVWSNRGLLKEGSRTVTVDESLFDLVIQPGELGVVFSKSILAGGGKKITVPPVALLDDNERMDRARSREALGLEPQGRYALFSLGPGNLKDVSGIGWSLIRRFEAMGFRVVWVKAPISVRDVELPEGVQAISVYPLARYLRAFDVFVGAAGYNTCIEMVQAQVPGLLIPNDLLADDQVRRAGMVAENAPVVVASCETEEDQQTAFARLLELLDTHLPAESPIAMTGASLAAAEIFALANTVGNRMSLAEEIRILYARLNEWARKLANRRSNRMRLAEETRILRARLNEWAQKPGCPRHRNQSWQAGLKHVDHVAEARPLLIWGEGRKHKFVRQACEGMKRLLQSHPEFVPVLVTDVADFAFFSRLGWLVEYLPSLSRNGDSYRDRKRRYLAWRYRQAVVVPLSAGLGSQVEWNELLESGGGR